MNKELAKQVETSEALHRLNNDDNPVSSIAFQSDAAPQTSATSSHGTSTSKAKQINLESIYDWIDKKDKLQKKRIQKLNKLKPSNALNDNHLLDRSIDPTITATKKPRSLPINYFLRKINKRGQKGNSQ